MEKQYDYERAGKYRLFHGSMNKFDRFSLEYKGLNGTDDGFGIYLTPNKEMASMYAEQTNKVGYIYEVSANLEKSLSTEELTVTDKELSKIIDVLQDSSDILNNFNDVDYYGKKVVKREAMAMLQDNENDVDLINEIANTIGDTEKTAEAFYSVGNYTHIVANERLLQKDTVVIVLQPERISIERIQDLNRELDVPSITEEPFSDNEDKLLEEEETVQAFWKSVLEQRRTFEVVGQYSNNQMTDKILFTPSTNSEDDYRLTTFDKQGEPVSHYDITNQQIDDTVAGKSYELLSHLPFATKDTTYKVYFDIDRENFNNINERSIDMAEDFKGTKVPEIPIREVVIKDFEQELETSRYYDKQAWQERIEYLNSSDILRFTLDEDVEEFYSSHTDEIEDKLLGMAETLGIERKSLLNGSENVSEVSYQRNASILAYKIVMDEINGEIENGKFKIPAMSEETENRILTVKNIENSQTFEME